MPGQATEDLFAVLRYDDAQAAFAWLRDAFGFQPGFVLPGPDGTITFAELWLGKDAIGSGTTRPGLRHAVSVYVPDVDAHYQRAVNAGVEISDPLADSEFARAYAARDLGGHLWSFGTYRPDKPPGGDIFPVLGYADTREAIEWLKHAFGLTERLIVEDGAGNIAHAEIGIGHSIVMPSGRDEADTSNPWSSIDFGLYVCVEDVGSHFERSRAVGAQIVRELGDTDYGASEYSVRDLEGNLWSFGTYRPEGSRPGGS